jgi:hypothetical protein
VRDYLDFIIGGIIYATALNTLITYSSYNPLPHYLLGPLFKRFLPLLAINLSSELSNEIIIISKSPGDFGANRSIFLESIKGSMVYLIKTILEETGICVMGLQSTFISHLLGTFIVNDLLWIRWVDLCGVLSNARVIVLALRERVFDSVGYAVSRCLIGYASAYIGNMVTRANGLPLGECLFYCIATKTFDIVMYANRPHNYSILSFQEQLKCIFGVRTFGWVRFLSWVNLRLRQRSKLIS